MRERVLEATTVLKQDGKPAQFALRVRGYLEDKFSVKWIRRGSNMVWPPRSLDLNTCDYSLWGIVKEKIFQLRLTTFEDLKTIIRECFNDFHTSAWKMPKKNMGEKLKFMWRLEGSIQINSN
jgi:hypothetical protein